MDILNEVRRLVDDNKSDSVNLMVELQKKEYEPRSRDEIKSFRTKSGMVASSIIEKTLFPNKRSKFSKRYIRWCSGYESWFDNWQFGKYCIAVKLQNLWKKNVTIEDSDAYIEGVLSMLKEDKSSSDIAHFVSP